MWWKSRQRQLTLLLTLSQSKALKRLNHRSTVLALRLKTSCSALPSNCCSWQPQWFGRLLPKYQKIDFSFTILSVVSAFWQVSFLILFLIIDCWTRFWVVVLFLRLVWLFHLSYGHTWLSWQWADSALHMNQV